MYAVKRDFYGSIRAYIFMVWLWRRIKCKYRGRITRLFFSLFLKIFFFDAIPMCYLIYWSYKVGDSKWPLWCIWTGVKWRRIWLHNIYNAFWQIMHKNKSTRFSKGFVVINNFFLSSMWEFQLNNFVGWGDAMVKSFCELSPFLFEIDHLGLCTFL